MIRARNGKVAYITRKGHSIGESNNWKRQLKRITAKAARREAEDLIIEQMATILKTRDGAPIDPILDIDIGEPPFAPLQRTYFEVEENAIGWWKKRPNLGKCKFTIGDRVAR